MAAISELKLTVDRLSHQVESKSTEVSATQGSLAEQTAYLATLESKLREQESLRRALHNTIQELKGNIRVFCRVRPAAAEAPRAIEASGHDAKLQLSHASSTHDFSFDKVFGASASQPQIFEEVDGLVQSSLDGYKVCIFAYGQTGSGKVSARGNEASRACASGAPARSTRPTRQSGSLPWLRIAAAAPRGKLRGVCQRGVPGAAPAALAPTAPLIIRATALPALPPLTRCCWRAAPAHPSLLSLRAPRRSRCRAALSRRAGASSRAPSRKF